MFAANPLRCRGGFMGCARAGKHLPSSGAAIWGRTTPMSCSRALWAPKRRTRGHRRRFKTRPDQQKRDCALLQRGRRGVWVPYRPVSAQNPRVRGVFAILASFARKTTKNGGARAWTGHTQLDVLEVQRLDSALCCGKYCNSCCRCYLRLYLYFYNYLYLFWV